MLAQIVWKVILLFQCNLTVDISDLNHVENIYIIWSSSVEIFIIYNINSNGYLKHRICIMYLETSNEIINKSLIQLQVLSL